MVNLGSCAAGTLFTVTGSFANNAGAATDPTTITLKFSQGASGFPINQWVYQGAGSISRSGTGVYVAELDTTALPGTWVGVWLGTGADQVTQPFTFTVTALPL